jgi:probable rRNA maturation factor
VNDDPNKPLVAVSDRQDMAIDAEALVNLAGETLRAEGASDVELSVSLVTEEEMADLHRRYGGEPGPTDVLSFPMDDRDAGRLLGDVVICPAVAARQGSDLAAELRLLLVHGILHLLGYDHQEEDEREAMWRRQEAYSGVRP